MFKHFSPLALASALVFLLPCASPAKALSAVTFVSGKGTNAGTCASPATPCRTFQFALGQTSPGGEIKALDPADYEPMTITKAISITGVEGAGINRTAAGNAFTIKAGSKDVINLTNLIIDGLNTGQTGIELASFGSLTVTHCIIRKFRGDGIDIFSSSGMEFLIADVVVSDNGGLGLELVGVPGTVDQANVNHNGIAKPCGFICGISKFESSLGSQLLSNLSCNCFCLSSEPILSRICGGYRSRSKRFVAETVSRAISAAAVRQR